MVGCPPIRSTFEGTGIHCQFLEASFLQLAVRWTDCGAFLSCVSLRSLILPNDIDLENIGDKVGYGIIHVSAIYRIAKAAECGLSL